LSFFLVTKVFTYWIREWTSLLPFICFKANPKFVFYFPYFSTIPTRFRTTLFQKHQIWLNTNRRKFNPRSTVLILSCHLSDPLRNFSTVLNCFDSLFLLWRCFENQFKLFFWLRWVCTSQMRETFKKKMEILVLD